jgi:hypothetical protein
LYEVGPQKVNVNKSVYISSWRRGSIVPGTDMEESQDPIVGEDVWDER